MKDLHEFTVIATYEGFSPFVLSIVDVNDYEEYVTFVIHNELHRCKLRTNTKGNYFIWNGSRIYLDECIRTGFMMQQPPKDNPPKVYARLRGK